MIVGQQERLVHQSTIPGWFACSKFNSAAFDFLYEIASKDRQNQVVNHLLDTKSSSSRNKFTSSAMNSRKEFNKFLRRGFARIGGETYAFATVDRVLRSWQVHYLAADASPENGDNNSQRRWWRTTGCRRQLSGGIVARHRSRPFLVDIGISFGGSFEGYSLHFTTDLSPRSVAA